MTSSGIRASRSICSGSTLFSRNVRSSARKRSPFSVASAESFGCGWMRSSRKLPRKSSLPKLGSFHSASRAASATWRASFSLTCFVATVGIVMMLIFTGFETDLTLIRSLGRAVALVAGFSVVLPLVLGLATGKLLPDSFVAQHGRGLFVLFIGAALAISSLPVIAKILSEMRLTRRNFGQVILAAGMANDVVAWLLLGALAGAARSGGFRPGYLA